MLGDYPPTGEADDYTWIDQEAGPLVRSFALTGGRARSGTSFDLLAYVVATDHAPTVIWQTQPEHRKILARAAMPISLAELASEVDLPLGVVRVLLGDLVELEAIAVQQPPANAGLPNDNVLKAVISALRTL
jgi:hypothetical protein